MIQTCWQLGNCKEVALSWLPFLSMIIFIYLFIIISGYLIIKLDIFNWFKTRGDVK